MNYLDGFASRWEELHTQLLDDYRDRDGMMPENCARVAKELAELLRRTGRPTEKYKVTGSPDAALEPTPLIPKPYEGRLRWRWHVGCASLGVMYDPMLSEPTPLARYPALAFDNPVEVRRTFWRRDEVNGIPW